MEIPRNHLVVFLVKSWPTLYCKIFSCLQILAFILKMAEVATATFALSMNFRINFHHSSQGIIKKKVNPMGSYRNTLVHDVCTNLS